LLPAVNGTIAESFLSLSVIYTSFYTEPFFCLKTEHKSLFSNKRMPDFVRIELLNAVFFGGNYVLQGQHQAFCA
ncbi:hypothetical protein, partial [Lactobacillus delbrueckii]|uniref:hypothetical protein n=1 Tax=Lactobacillus delbrueckii TaxID=1584 RepID=UPI0021A60473